jgi:ribosomal protein S6
LRRYELMLVIRPDVADDKSQALVDRTTRGIVASGGQIVKGRPVGAPPPGLPDRPTS